MRRNYLKLFVASITGLCVLLPAVPVSAAGASLSLTANHSVLSNGSTLIVAVYMNGGGTPVNAVEADLNYPASKLQYVGLNYSGGSFSISTQGDGGGNGAVSIQNGAINPVSGSGLVATVTFRALSSSGSAYIGVSGSSALVSASTNQPIAFSSSGVSVNFGASSSSSHSSSAPAAPTAPAPPKDTTPPVIDNIKVTDLTPFGATITWTTNKASNSEVDYGLDTSYGLSASSTTVGTTHSVALDSEFLTPETLYHYHVKSTDASGNVGVGPDEHFALPGVKVTIVVLGANGKPESGATVTLDGATSTTDSKGQVTLPSSLGNKKITTTFNGVTVQKPITVARSAKPLPPYQLDMAKQPLNRWMLTSVGLFIIVLVLLGIDALLFGSRFFMRLAGLHWAPALPSVHMPHLQLKHEPKAPTVSSPAAPANSDKVDEMMESKPETYIPRPGVETFEKPQTAPITHFNVQTTGESQTPPSLRAIDNIQPLSVRRSPVPPATPTSEARKITVADASSDDSASTAPPVLKAADTKPKPAKKHHSRKPRKAFKKPPKSTSTTVPTAS